MTFAREKESIQQSNHFRSGIIRSESYENIARKLQSDFNLTYR
jgi:hypothetical protein